MQELEILKREIEYSIEMANAGASFLTKEILNSSGFSGHKIKHLLNNLVNPRTNYLECGVLRGSTFISALYNNSPLSAFAVDNWSEFGATQQEFLTICKYHGIDDFKTINKNCFELTREDIPEKINLFFYDAGHEFEDHRNAIIKFDQFLSDEFILVVDDYSWDKVRDGTQSGLKEMNYEVVFSQYLFSEENRETEYWNGIWIGAIKKRPKRKLIYATYVDHQPEVNYPVAFLKSEIPELKVFCSDEFHEKYLDVMCDIDAESIDHGINEAMDISIVQNICIDKLFSEGADFVCWIQADTYLSAEAKRIIKEFCTDENLSQAIALKVRHIRAFHLAFSSYYGPNVIGKTCASRYTGDGAYTGTPGKIAGGSEIRGSDDCCIDIGYLTIDQFRKHISQHEKTYAPGSDHGTSGLTDKEFIRHVIDNKGYYTDLQGLIAEDSIYFDLVKKLELVKEYNYVKSLL